MGEIRREIKFDGEVVSLTTGAVETDDDEVTAVVWFFGSGGEGTRIRFDAPGGVFSLRNKIVLRCDLAGEA
jgi:hypothetical protein